MIRETYKLIEAIKKMYPVSQFFKNRYFPDGGNYFSEKVLIESKKKGRNIAPFVVPVVGGIAMEDQGYRAEYIDAPWIAPKMAITAADLEKKAFGESPESGRTPAQRENEIEAEHMDDLRKSVFRRHEQMCTELLLTGQILMKHFATADDAAKGSNYELKYLRHFDGEFKNRYKFAGKKFAEMTASEKIKEFYKMAAVLRARGIRATDIVMTGDVSMMLMSDKDFLDFYDKARVEFGDIKQTELPDGVACNGRININGVVMTMFTYDEIYEDLDGEEKEFLPKGTIMMLKPAIGKTVYAQVTFYSNGSGFNSYAEKIVPRLVGNEQNNAAEVQVFSRPVMYPLDRDSWLVANIYDEPVSQSEADNSIDTSEPATAAGSALKTEAQIMAMTKKADVIAYAESIGLSGLDAEMKLDELKNEVLNYQEETYDEL